MLQTFSLLPNVEDFLHLLATEKKENLLTLGAKGGRSGARREYISLTESSFKEIFSKNQYIHKKWWRHTSLPEEGPDLGESL